MHGLQEFNTVQLLRVICCGFVTSKLVSHSHSQSMNWALLFSCHFSHGSLKLKCSKIEIKAAFKESMEKTTSGRLNDIYTETLDHHTASLNTVF